MKTPMSTHSTRLDQVSSTWNHWTARVERQANVILGKSIENIVVIHTVRSTQEKIDHRFRMYYDISLQNGLVYVVLSESAPQGQTMFPLTMRTPP